jgi:hypothetical protein
LGYLEDKILDWNPRKPNPLIGILSPKKRNKRKEEGQEETENAGTGYNPNIH